MQNYKQEVQMKNFQPVISPYLYVNPSLPFGMVRGCLDKREKKKYKYLIHLLKSPRNFLSVSQNLWNHKCFKQFNIYPRKVSV